jgi:hypothetical protein
MVFTWSFLPVGKVCNDDGHAPVAQLLSVQADTSFSNISCKRHQGCKDSQCIWVAQ